MSLYSSLFKNPEKNPRIIALQELLDSIENESILIWCRFKEDIRQIEDGIDSLPLVITGETNKERRQKRLDMWLQGEFRLLVATTGTIGEGLNLQGLCHRAIYYSNSENSIARWQSEDRIHRIGIHKACTYTDIIAKGSRDHILANLKKKDLFNMWGY